MQFDSQFHIKYRINTVVSTERQHLRWPEVIEILDMAFFVSTDDKRFIGTLHVQRIDHLPVSSLVLSASSNRGSTSQLKCEYIADLKFLSNRVEHKIKRVSASSLSINKDEIGAQDEVRTFLLFCIVCIIKYSLALREVTALCVCGIHFTANPTGQASWASSSMLFFYRTCACVMYW